MPNAFMSRPAPMRDPSAGSHATEAMYDTHACAQARRSDEEFVAMLETYRGSGGLARAEEVVALSMHRCGRDAATLARWIVAREVISFEWQSQTWLPMFQFDRVDLTPRPELAPVFAELAAVRDPWELAGWFARPNALLADRTPVDALVSDLPAVLHAACVDAGIGNG